VWRKGSKMSRILFSSWAKSIIPSFCSLSKHVKPSCGTPNHRNLTPGYQPVSFKLDSRSGTPDEFEDMVSRLGNAQVMGWPNHQGSRSPGTLKTSQMLCFQ
jgi:hypothetical protein